LPECRPARNQCFFLSDSKTRFRCSNASRLIGASIPCQTTLYIEC
jgi:hypothetical protein